MAKTVQRFCYVCRKRFRRKQSDDALRPLAWRDFCSNRCKGIGRSTGFKTTCGAYPLAGGAGPGILDR